MGAYIRLGITSEVFDLSFDLLRLLKNYKNHGFYSIYNNKMLYSFGVNYENLGNYELAEFFHKIALFVDKERYLRYKHLYLYKGYSNSFIRLSECLLKDSKYNKALQNLNNAYRIALDLDNSYKSKLAVIHADYGKVYIETGKLDSAKHHLVKAQASKR